MKRNIFAILFLELTEHKKSVTRTINQSIIEIAVSISVGKG